MEVELCLFGPRFFFSFGQFLLPFPTQSCCCMLFGVIDQLPFPHRAHPSAFPCSASSEEAFPSRSFRPPVTFVGPRMRDASTGSAVFFTKGAKPLFRHPVNLSLKGLCPSSWFQTNIGHFLSVRLSFPMDRVRPLFFPAGVLPLTPFPK